MHWVESIRRPAIRLLRPVANCIKNNIGALGFLGGLSAFAFGLQVMGYTLPAEVGFLILLVGIIIASLSPFYAKSLYDWPLRYKLVCSVAMAIILGGITAWSVMGTPTMLRPILSDLNPIADSQYRRLVAETLIAFDPAADIQVGGTIVGPDGERRTDVVIRSVMDGRLTKTLIDVFDLPSSPVGIESVDGIDSRRTDVKADFALIYSNTGFDAVAIRKAARVNVGLLSLLREGDKRIRAVIEQEIYLRRITIGPVTVDFNANSPHERDIIVGATQSDPHGLTYDGGSVTDWLQHRAVMIVVDNPSVTVRLRANYNFKKVTEFEVGGQVVALKAIAISFQPKTEWLSQTVQLDAAAGIYDYVRGRVRMAPGNFRYVIRGVNFDEAVPLSEPPKVTFPGVGLMPGELDMTLLMLKELNLSGASKLPPLEELVQPEDLTTEIQTGAPKPAQLAPGILEYRIQ